MLNLVVHSTSKVLHGPDVFARSVHRDRLLDGLGTSQLGGAEEFSMAGQYAGSDCELELVCSSLIRVCHGASERVRPESRRRNPAGGNDYLPGNHSRTCPGGSGHLFD